MILNILKLIIIYRFHQEKTARVYVRYVTTLRPYYSQPWVMTKICNGIKIDIQHCPKNLKIDAEALHPVEFYDDDKKREVYATPYNQLLRGKGNLIWEIKEGLLPFQGIRLFWEKTD